MPLTKQLNMVSSNLSLCKKLNCGGVANRLKIKINKNKEVRAYFATYVDSKNHFRGRCTWGAAGFNFDVWIAQSQGALTVVFNSLQPTIGINYVDGALEVFFNRLNKNLTAKANRLRGGGNFKAPQLAAHKYGPYKQTTTHKRIKLWVQRKVFDRAFGDFVIRHVNQGLRCRGK